MTSPTTRPPLTLTPARLDQAIESDPDTPSTNDDARDRRRTLAFRALVVVMVLVLGALLIYTRTAASTETDLATLVRLLDVRCTEGNAGDKLDQLCRQTEQVRADNADAVAAAGGLDTDQVIALIRAELAANPAAGRPPSASAVLAAARTVLAENPDAFRGLPGADGPGPTEEQVRAAAAAVIAADPDAFRGADGESPPCLSEPAQCRGNQGVGLDSLRFERRDGRCVAVAILRDPADGSTSEATAPVADAVCEPADPPQPPPEPSPTPDPTATPTPEPDPTAPAPAEPTP